MNIPSKLIKVSIFIVIVFNLNYASLWSSTKLELLYGQGYKLGSENAGIFSFTHASGWKYGDNFFFFDVTINPSERPLSIYAEYSPHIGLFNLFKKDTKDRILKNINLSGGLEFPGYSLRELIGMGITLNLRGLKRLSIDLYLRNDHTQESVTWQVTTSWSSELKRNKFRIVADGFFDLAGPEGELYTNLVFQPAFMWDPSIIWSDGDKILIGTELSIWINKYGVNNTNEFVPQINLRWNF